MDCTLYPARFLHPWDSPAGILEFIAISFSDPDANGGSDSKASAYNAGVLGSIPGPGRSPGEENGNPLQYSCLENPMDGEAWWATVHGVAKSQTRLSDFTSLHFTSLSDPGINSHLLHCQVDSLPLGCQRSPGFVV